MLPCSSEMNWLVPLFPQNLFSYHPCTPILSLFTQFQHDVLRDNKYGNGFCVNFIESEAQKRVPGIRKKHCRIRRHQIDQIKTKKMIPARNSHIHVTSALNLITYVYMCISST